MFASVPVSGDDLTLRLCLALNLLTLSPGAAQSEPKHQTVITFRILKPCQFLKKELVCIVCNEHPYINNATENSLKFA